MNVVSERRRVTHQSGELTVAGYRCCLAISGQPASSSGRLFDPTGSPLPPLLLIHGAANDRDVWHALANGLAAAGCAVLAADLPGHGLSAGAALPSIEALANWLPALLDAAGVGKAILVGHSMGSLVALECAARHPHRVSQLALLGSSAPMPVATALLERAETHPDAVYRLMIEYSHTLRFQLAGGSGHGVWGPGVTLAIMRRSPPGVLAIDLANCNNYLHGLEAAAQIACPTLLIVARRDRMTPRRNLPPLQSALPRVSRVEIPDCGHAMMNEQPQAVVRELLKFLGNTGTPVTAAPAGVPSSPRPNVPER